MALHNSNNTEAGRSVVGSTGSASRAATIARRWAKSRRQTLVVSILIFSDTLLALAVWQVALVFQGILGHWELSGIAIASTLPYLVVWVGLRASLGLYPGYGLDQAEELRRQTLALLATLTITLVFAFASQLELSRLLICVWSLGLLMVAPVARYL